MHLASYYEIQCPCGKTFETEATELTCSKCSRKLSIEWPSAAKVERTADQAQKANNGPVLVKRSAA